MGDRAGVDVVIDTANAVLRVIGPSLLCCRNRGAIDINRLRLE